MQTQESSMYPLILAGAVILTGVVLGIVLLVVGLAKKKTPVWAAGIAFLAVSVIAMVAMPFLAAFLMVSRTVNTMMTTMGPQMMASMTVNSALLSDDITEVLGLPAEAELPLGITISQDAPYPNASFDTRHVVITAADDLAPVLSEWFEDSTWAAFRDSLGRRAPPLAGWSRAAMEKMPCYMREFTTDAGGEYEVHACYDKAGGRLYCVIKEITAPTVGVDELPELELEPMPVPVPSPEEP